MAEEVKNKGIKYTSAIDLPKNAKEKKRRESRAKKGK